MSDMARKMLDELMGTNRDGAQGEDSVKFTDSEVCKSYLLGLCPYDLFHSTGSFKSSKKLDMGVCTQVHDPALKADYELAADGKDYDYEFEQCQQITQFVEDCDRKVAANKKRLEETQDQESLGPEAQAVHELNEQIGKKLSDAEELGEAGNVEESMKIMAEIEELKADKRKAEDLYRNTVPATQNQQQKLRVCEICAAFLSLYDNDRRLADHFGGRLHMGFISVRDRLEELQKITEEKRENANKRRTERRERDREREEKERSEKEDSKEQVKEDKDTEKEEIDRHRSSRDKNRDKDRDRDRDRNRDRDMDRDRNRDRDRDRDRRRSERDRDRDRDRRRRRSRSRSRDRRRSRRSRSRSRDKRREREGSRSRDRSRERRREKEGSRSSEKKKEQSPPPMKDKNDTTETVNEDKVENIEIDETKTPPTEESDTAVIVEKSTDEQMPDVPATDTPDTSAQSDGATAQDEPISENEVQ